MAKKRSHSLEEMREFLARSTKSLDELQITMAKRYHLAFFNEMTGYDTKASELQAEIKRLKDAIARKERKLLDEKERKL